MAKKNKNPFKKLESQEEVPVELKDKVMTTITLAHLAGDFGELFTAKMAGTASKMMDVANDKRSTRKKKKK